MNSIQTTMVMEFDSYHFLLSPFSHSLLHCLLIGVATLLATKNETPPPPLPFYFFLLGVMIDVATLIL
jgi:hypothetical protein